MEKYSHDKDDVIQRLQVYVQEKMNLYTKCTYNELIDEIKERIKLKEEAKSLNKKRKDAWNETINIINDIYDTLGIDFML